MGSNSKFIRGDENGIKAQDELWFAENFTPVLDIGEVEDIIIQIIATVPAVVEITLNGGTDWNVINNGNPIPLGLSQFEIFTIKSSEINLRTPDAAGIDLRRVQLISRLEA